MIIISIIIFLLICGLKMLISKIIRRLLYNLYKKLREGRTKKMIKTQPHSKNNDCQKHCTEYILEKYWHLLEWKNDGNILVVGSGDGEVLMTVLLPKLPKKYGKIIGIDVSEDMVNFAKETYQDDKVRFVKMDITAPEVPDDFRAGFHHIFSFYCFHWFTEHRQAVKNIFTMLKPGGQILIHVFCANPLFDVYNKMAESSEWAPYLQNTKSNISPYLNSSDPEEEFAQILKEEGFVNSTCRIETLSHLFPHFPAFRTFLASINPFLDKLPGSKKDEYIEDLIKECRNMKNFSIETTKDGEESIRKTYKLLVVHSSKP